MRIAVNLLPYRSYEAIEACMVNVLNRIAKDYPEVELILIKHTQSPEFFNIKGAKVSDYTVDIKNASGWRVLLLSQTAIYGILKKIDPDLLFCPYPHVPFFYKRTVVTVYDCAYDHFKKESYFTIRMYMKLMFLSIKLFAKKIMTISEFSKEDLVKTWNIDPSRVRVVQIALPDIPSASDAVEERLIEKYRLSKGKYFLFVGVARYRKNILGIIEAFKKLNETHAEYKLVLVGKRDSRFDKIAERIEELGIGDRVVLTGYLNDQEKMSIYKGASAVLFPSFYEGFGLPILEGQEIGVPVLTSNISSMPEVGGDGALYVDPYSIDSIAEGMRKLADDGPFRDELIVKGRENLKRFSFDRTAKETVEVFKEALR